MTIEERLENMERELGKSKRHSRWLLGAVLLVAGSLVVPAVFETMAFPARAQATGTATNIWANKFNIEDNNGKSRGYLGMGHYGPALVMTDIFDKPRVILSVEIDRPHLDLLDENGKVIWSAIK